MDLKGFFGKIKINANSKKLNGYLSKIKGVFLKDKGSNTTDKKIELNKDFKEKDKKNISEENLQDNTQVENVSKSENNDKKSEIGTEKKPNSALDEIFGGEAEDVFKPILDKKEKILNISGKKEKSKLSISGDEDEDGENPEEKRTRNLLANLIRVSLILIAISFPLGAGITTFYYLVSDEENVIFSNYGYKTIGSIHKESDEFLKGKQTEKESIEKSIDELIGGIPERIYFNSNGFPTLSERLKSELLRFYDGKTGKLNELNPKEMEKLDKLYKNNMDLYNLKSVFEKEYVLNEVNEKKIYWKEVHKSLMEATNNAFKYNEILNYIKYNNFSVNEAGGINVSGVVMDPSGKVFAQLIKLVKSINDSENFEGANISTFQKTINPDENVGGMVSAINLSFSYKK